MFNIKFQMSDTFLIGGLLAFAGGFMDAYSYIVRGGVFANAQTGNIVLLGINIFNGNFTKCTFYLISIVSFVIGIVVTELIKFKFKEETSIHWRQIIVLTETIILFLVGFIPKGNYDTIANVLISFVCSLQVESFRKVNGLVCATTMCTGNLRSASENLFRYIVNHDKQSLKNSLSYYAIILIFILGASIGAWAINVFNIKSIWIICMVIFIDFLLMLYKPNNK